MKQTTKTLATMGGFAAVALAIAFLAAWAGKDEEKKSEAKEQSAKLVELDKSAAREMKLEKAGKPVAELKRDDDKGAWKIVAPIQAEADETQASALLDKIVGLKSKTTLDDMDAKKAGVADEASAKLVVSIADAAGKSQTILFGEENPFDQSVFVKKLGEAAVRTMAKSDETPLDKPLFELRDKRVAHVEESAGIDDLTVTPDASATVKGEAAGAAGTFAYELKRESGQWKLAQPPTPSGLADTGQADRLIAAVKNLRATQVVSETSDEKLLEQYGLAKPKVTIAMTVAPMGSKDTFARKLLLGQPPVTAGSVTIKTYAKRDDAPAIYEVDNQIVKDLARDLSDLEDKTVLKIDREQVRRIEYSQSSAAPVVVMRTKDAAADGGTAEEKFTVTAPEQGPGRKFKIQGNLFALSALKAAAFDGPKPDAKGLAKYGLDQPRKVTIYGDNSSVLGQLEIGAATPDKDKKRHYALVSGESRLLEIEDSIVNDLPFTAKEAIEAPAGGSSNSAPPAATPLDAAKALTPVPMPTPGK